MSVVIDRPAEQRDHQAQLKAEAQATIEANGVRRLGHLEAARGLFANVCGTGRTDTACQLGKVLSDALSEEKGIPAKKKLLAEMAKQICNAYSDDGKLKSFIVLYHVSLRVSSLKLLGLTWAQKMVQAMSTGFDWKAVCDDMTAVKIERANAILPKLIDGVDGLGVDAKTGNPVRAEWAKIVRHYLEHESLPVAKPETVPASPATTQEPETVPASPATTQEPANPVASLAMWLDAQNLENMAGLTSLLSQETIQRMFDALDNEVTARKTANTWK